MTIASHRFGRLGLAALAAFSLATAAGAAQVTAEQMNLPAGAVPEKVQGTFDPLPAAPDAQADAFAFPSATSTIVSGIAGGLVDGEQAGYFWSVSRGDSVVESFAGPASIFAYELHVDVIENVLNSGAFVNWDVIINGVTVDNFTVNQGFLGTVNRTAGFATIAGPNYTVELRVTNEVAGGQGSHTLRYAGVGNHSVVLLSQGLIQAIPALSPLGLTLLALGLLTLGFWLVRRRRAS